MSNRPKQTKSQRQECVLNYFADQMVGIWAIETGSIAAIETGTLTTSTSLVNGRQVVVVVSTLQDLALRLLDYSNSLFTWIEWGKKRRSQAVFIS